MIRRAVAPAHLLWELSPADLDLPRRTLLVRARKAAPSSPTNKALAATRTISAAIINMVDSVDWVTRAQVAINNNSSRRAVMETMVALVDMVEATAVVAGAETMEASTRPVTQASL